MKNVETVIQSMSHTPRPDALNTSPVVPPPHTSVPPVPLPAILSPTSFCSFSSLAPALPSPLPAGPPPILPRAPPPASPHRLVHPPATSHSAHAAAAVLYYYYYCYYNYY